MVPAARATVVARVVRLMPMASYRGTRGGTQMRKVTAPEPSRWTHMASRAVPRVMSTGLPPMRRMMPLMIGRKVPASVRMPKNRMENRNITPVAATEPMPWAPTIMPPRFLAFCRKSMRPGAASGSVTVKPQEMSPVTSGAAIKATVGVSFFQIISASIRATVRKPRKASMETSPSTGKRPLPQGSLSVYSFGTCPGRANPLSGPGARSARRPCSLLYRQDMAAVGLLLYIDEGGAAILGPFQGAQAGELAPLHAGGPAKPGQVRHNLGVAG